METIPHEKQDFLKWFDRHEPKNRDSTAMRAFMKCPRYYFLSIVLGFRFKGAAIFLAYGSVVHKFRELLEIEHKKGCEFKDCLNTAANEALKIWPGDPIPGQHKWDYLTKSYLTMTFLAHFESWVVEKKRGDIEVISVEQPFHVAICDADGNITPHRSGGKADQIIRWNGKLWVRDFKTTGKTPGYYQKTITPHDQFTRYIHGAKVLVGEFPVGILIDVTHHSKATKNNDGKPKLSRIPIMYTPQQIERWEQEQIIWEKHIDICRETDIWPEAQDNYHTCSNCMFREVCSSGSQIGMKAKLESHFKQVPWDYNNIQNEF